MLMSRSARGWTVTAAVAALVGGIGAAVSFAAAPPGPPPAPAVAPAPGQPLETRPRNGTTYEPAFAGQTRIAGVDSQQKLDVQVVAKGLTSPWAVELLPDGRFLVTERGGNLRIVAADGTVSAPVQGLPAVLAGGQGGLLDVALDPDFARNKTIYWSFSEARDGGNGTSLGKGVLVEQGGTAKLDGVQVIFRQQPALNSSLHFGSRIAFGRDGKLFLSLGERSIPAGQVQAQDLNSHLGKVVRINTDGTVPSDNPFVGRAGVKPEIWSYGHRNVQGATVDSATGKLWTMEHGPRGGDELNQPRAGLNYGWPIISYGIDYSGRKMGDGIQQKEGMEQPVYYWDPVIAPGGLMVYQGNLFPKWKGSIFVCALGGTKLVRLQMNGDKVVGEEWLLADRRQRVRDVQQGPDGSIYVLNESGADSLLRLRPGT
jgi:glucose/arabinose dehydrogenase